MLAGRNGKAMKVPHTAVRAASRPGARLDRARQAAPQAFAWLRNAILSLELPPGSPLSCSTTD